MTNEEAIKIIQYGLIDENYPVVVNVAKEALNMSIKALEFQDKFIDIIAQAVVNSGCDSLEEFCEKCGIDLEEVEND